MHADLSPSAYDVFAQYYDAFTQASDYEAWTDAVLAVLLEHGLAGERMLDVACGTGKSFIPFLRRGFDVVACDASPAMLAEAALKAPAVELLRCDLRTLRTLGSFDLVTCFDDSLNYLLDEVDFASALAGIARNLPPGGLLAFDLNTLLTYRTTFATHAVSESDGVLFAWRGLVDQATVAAGCGADARIDVFAPVEGDRYERVVSTHRQRHYPRDRVLALLSHAGLEPLAVHGVRDDVSLDDDADEERCQKVLYTARRAEGGDA
jgi:SAM-dependent methyltransferase